MENHKSAFRSINEGLMDILGTGGRGNPNPEPEQKTGPDLSAAVEEAGAVAERFDDAGWYISDLKDVEHGVRFTMSDQSGAPALYCDYYASQESWEITMTMETYQGGEFVNRSNGKTLSEAVEATVLALEEDGQGILDAAAKINRVS